MECCRGFISCLLLASASIAQTPATSNMATAAPASVAAVTVMEPCASTVELNRKTGLRARLEGNHDFDNFIGFMSNPLQNIDPRAMTALWPMFGSTWFSTVPALPEGDAQIYGPGLYVALSDRFMFGLNQGGYSVLHLERGRLGAFLDRFGLLRDRSQFNGDRAGWLNFGGFLQYTVIADVPNQFLMTGGLRWEAPSGSKSVFQGSPPVKLAPYVTIGKEFGCNHLLATTGFEFPVDSGQPDNSTFFYTNVHLDRKIGWLYPLVEFNWTYHTRSVEVDLPTRRGFFDFGNFSSTGNVVTMAVGANAVLRQNKLEIGAVYSTPLYTTRNFDFDGLLVKMLIRF